MVMAKTKKTVKDTLKKVLSKTKTTAKTTKNSCECNTTAKGDCATTKTKTAKATAAAKTTAAKGVYIDYPLNNENVYCGHYCFRIGTVGNSEWVKVSLNGGPWQYCRSANGYWWYDWWNFQTGTFTAEAVALLDGKEVKTAKRKFKVTL